MQTLNLDRRESYALTYEHLEHWANVRTFLVVWRLSLLIHYGYYNLACCTRKVHSIRKLENLVNIIL